jgi:hypothetical protein
MAGCSCKNKGNQQTTQTSTTQPTTAQRQVVKNQTVQESVKKVIEKYYNKK